MDINKFASDIIFESDLQHDLPIKEVPEIVDGAIWLDELKITDTERQEIIDKVIELLPIKGWGK
jgi:hypothetical protein